MVCRSFKLESGSYDLAILDRMRARLRQHGNWVTRSVRDIMMGCGYRNRPKILMWSVKT